MKKTMVPSVDFWFRAEFLAARKAQTEFAKQQAEGKPNVHIVDSGDDIVCDTCSNVVDDNGELINLVGFGRRVVCDSCYQRNHAKEPIKYRVMNEDGSLGEYIKLEDL